MATFLILWMFLVQCSVGKDVGNLFTSDVLRTDSDVATENGSMTDNPSNLLRKSPKVSRGPLRQMFPKYEEIEDISEKNAGISNWI